MGKTGTVAGMAEEDVERLRGELESANAQLVEAHHMASLGRLLAGIVHEINTPIGSIFSNNEVIARSLEKLRAIVDDPQPIELQKARRILDTCQNLASIDKIACERIASVIRGLKTFARPSDEWRKVNLNEILRDTLKLTQAEFRKRIKVETEFGDLPEVECLPHMLSQVFLNILVNAGQAIEGEGRVMVRTECEGDTAMVSVSDTGRGIPPEQLQRVFEAGFTTKPPGVGTGLGLSISRQIVEERHGGSLAVQSRVGQGTSFFIRIPIQQARRGQGV